MTSSRPYLVRAIYDWIADNGLTPQLIVNAEMPGVMVPPEHVREGKIVLNVAARAVRELSLGNELIEFDARFSGRGQHVCLPMRAVLAVYASENGVGMAFQDEQSDGPSPSDGGDRVSRPHLKVVK